MNNLHGLVTMTNTEYHAGPGISSTQLKTIGISPLAYWDAYINPEREARKYKHCFAVGDGTHKLVLEPGTFEHTYAVGFDKSAYPTALDTVADLKKALSELNLMVSGTKPELAARLVHEGGYDPKKIMYYLEAQHNESIKDKIAIPANDYKDMQNMLKAVWQNPIAAGLLDGGTTEESYFWTDENGILRKARTDLITSDRDFIIDLKTTDDVSQEGFGRTIAAYGYHVSAAWYLDVLYGLYGEDAPQEYAFIAVQKKRPYDVAVHFLTQDQIKLGRLIYKKYLRTLMDCMETGYFPGIAWDKPLEVKLPTWEMNKLEWLQGEAVANGY